MGLLVHLANKDFKDYKVHLGLMDIQAILVYLVEMAT
jgi:hypothetical protein